MKNAIILVLICLSMVGCMRKEKEREKSADEILFGMGVGEVIKLR